MSFIEIIIWIAYIFTVYTIVYWFLLFLDYLPHIKKEYAESINLQSYPLVSIIVPAWNEEKTITKTLKSLILLDWPKDKLEIIVINDGSKDKTSYRVKQFIRHHQNEPIQLINQINQGKASALNNGLKILKGKYFSCLDADSVVEADALKRLINRHQQDKLIAIATPIMKISKPKKLIQHLQKIEYVAGMFMAKLLGYVNANYVAPGPFSTYKTHIIRELGGFAEDNLVEDQEIAYRAQKAHYKIVQVPKAVVHTISPNTINKFCKQRNRWYKGTIINIYKYRKLMFKKEYGDFGFFQLPVVNSAAFILSVVAVFSFIHYAIIPLIRSIHNAWLFNFNILPFFKSFTFSFDIFAFQAPLFLILFLSLVLSLVFILISGKLNKDKLSKSAIYFVPFFFIYFLVIAYVVVTVLGELLIGKKQRW